MSGLSVAGSASVFRHEVQPLALMLARGCGAYEIRCHGCGAAVHVMTAVDETGLPLGAEDFELDFAIHHDGHTPQPAYTTPEKSCNAPVIDLRSPSS